MCLPGTAQASDKHVSLPLTPARLNISEQFYLAVDPGGSKTFAEMQRAEFKPLEGAFSAGYSTQAYWLRFTLSDPSEKVQQWYLELEQPFIDHVDFYEAVPGGQFRHVTVGDMHPFSLREIPSQGFVFQLSPGVEPTTYYLRLKSSGAIWVKAVLWHHTLFANQSVRYAHMLAIAYGALLLLMLVALVQGLVFKESVYLAFVAHTGAVLLVLTTGVLPLYLPDNWYLLMDALPPVAVCLDVAAYAIFCNYFLLGKQNSRIYGGLFFLLAVAGLLSAVAVISPDFRWIIPGVLVLKIVGTLLPVIATSRYVLRGNWYDRLVWLGLVAYVPAQAMLFLRLSSTSTSALQSSISDSPLQAYTLVIFLHMLLLGFALAERLRNVRLLGEKNRHLQNQLTTERMVKDLANKTAFDQRSFLTMVAHELRRPLAEAHGAVSSLLSLSKPLSANGLAAERLSQVDNNLQQMASLVDVCLTHEREGFAQPLSLNTRTTVAQLYALVQPLLAEPVAARVAWHHTSAEASQTIACNPALIAMAVRSMVENACTNDPTGAPISVVWQGQTDNSKHWCISVLDRRPGVQTDEITQILQSLVERNPESCGSMGLFIVGRIASMHGAIANVGLREGGGCVTSIAFGAVTQTAVLSPTQIP